MEINIENAFVIVAKISIRPFVSSKNTITKKIQKAGHQLVLGILEKPLISTFLLTGLLIMFLSILTMALIIMIAVCCLVAVLIIFQGFIFGVILILAAIISLILMGFIILSLGLKLLFEKKTVNVKR